MDDLQSYHRILRIINSLVRNDVIDKEELAMELFLKNPHASRRFIKWKCIDAGRARIRELEAYENKLRSSPEPFNGTGEYVNRLVSLARLDPSERHLLYLRHWKGLSIRWISQELSSSEYSISQKLDSIYEKLRLVSYSQELENHV